jgi:hypothetical protein
MNVGIITYHCAHNYGAMLQAYALCKTLEGKGNEVRFVDFYPMRAELKNKRKLPVRNLRGLIVRGVEMLLYPVFKKRFLNFESFRERYLPVTNVRYKTDAELEKVPPVFDAFICGSDQIWNMEQGGTPAFFLRFPTGKSKRLAYAASFGRGEVPEQYKEKLADWLKSYDSISVRESSGIDIIKNATGMDVPQVMDPVFLLKITDWSAIAKEAVYKGEYIAFYSLEVSRELSDLVEFISGKFNIPVVVLGKGGRFILKCKSKMAIDSGPAEFLGWFKNARFVITNSFHATAFSLIFNKPFYSVPHSTRNTRLESLLKLVDLQSRQITSLSTIKELNAEEIMNIDYSHVNSIIEAEANRSDQFLKCSISNN